MNAVQGPSPRLPVRRHLALNYATSLLVAVLVAAASIGGLLYHPAVYPTDELLQSLVPNDVVNLGIGLPILLGSMWLAWRGKLIGLLLWPGALFYVLYNSIAYVLALPLNVAYVLHLALVALSAYGLASLVAGMDGDAVQRRLHGAVPERLGGLILAGLGLLFFLLALGGLVRGLTSQTPVPDPDLAVLTADLVISPAWIIGGLSLWQRRELGYLTGLGLLFQASMLFVGLIVFMLVQPSLTTEPFHLADVVAILVMGLVCLIPFALFVRGIASKRSLSST